MPTVSRRCLSHSASHLWLSTTRRIAATLLVSAALGYSADPVPPQPPAPKPLFTDQEWSSTPTTNEHGSSGNLTSIVISLAVVSGVAVGLGLLVRRIGLQRLNTPRGRHMEVIDQLALGPKRSVCLLRVSDQILVLGHGDHGITQLATLPAAAITSASPAIPVPTPVPTQPPADGDATAAFRAALARATGRTTTP
jgi:flagellar biosynthetic protein FliO